MPPCTYTVEAMQVRGVGWWVNKGLTVHRALAWATAHAGDPLVSKVRIRCGA